MRSLYYYKAHGRDDCAVRQRIKEIAATRVRYGMDRIHGRFQREGWIDSHKRVRRNLSFGNGSEFISKILDFWAHENNVILDFSRPDKPTDNAFIESFNGSFRDECLNTNWFLSLEDAKEKIQAFKEEYSHFRPHSALGNLTPIEALSRHPKSPKILL